MSQSLSGRRTRVGSPPTVLRGLEERPGVEPRGLHEGTVIPEQSPGSPTGHTKLPAVPSRFNQGLFLSEPRFPQVLAWPGTKRQRSRDIRWGPLITARDSQLNSLCPDGQGYPARERSNPSKSFSQTLPRAGSHVVRGGRETSSESLKRPGTAPQARPADAPLPSPATVPPLSNGTSDAAWAQDERGSLKRTSAALSPSPHGAGGRGRP